VDDAVKVLERSVGTWNADIETSLPEGNEKTRGTMVGRLLGGRWLVLEFKNENGFEGHGIYGYDPDAKQFVGTWVDSLRGFLATGHGSWDEASRIVSYRYEHTVAGRMMAWREEATFNADGTQSFRVVTTEPDGTETVRMKVLYRRKPAK